MSRLATFTVLVCFLIVVQLGTQVLAQDAKPDDPPLLKADPLPAAKSLGVPLGEPLPAPAAFDAPRFSARFSADGKMVLTARRPPFIASKGVSSEARLWDAATGKPLGPPLSFKSQGVSVLIALHDKSVVTVRRDGGTGKNPKSEMQSWDAHCSFCHDSLDFQMTKRRSLEWAPDPLQRLEACATGFCEKPLHHLLGNVFGIWRL